MSDPQPLSLTVHSQPSPQAALNAAQRISRGRRFMLTVFLICLMPVVASYLAYYVFKPQGRRNFGELIEPQRPLPDIVGRSLDGKTMSLPQLKDQWLLISVASGACDERCQKNLYFQRQLLTSLGKERDRTEWVWLINDQADVPVAIVPALKEATVLRVEAAALAKWLTPAEHHALPEHLFVVDPMGNWMMRFPANIDAASAVKAKVDLERLLRGAGGWDKPGRPGDSETPTSFLKK